MNPSAFLTARHKKPIVDYTRLNVPPYDPDEPVGPRCFRCGSFETGSGTNSGGHPLDWMCHVCGLHWPCECNRNYCIGCVSEQCNIRKLRGPWWVKAEKCCCASAREDKWFVETQKNLLTQNDAQE